VKKALFALSAVAAAAAGFTTTAAQAQSSVNLYGIIDDGPTYVSNVGGHKQYLMQSSISQGNRWGLRGVEDLGGGNSAVFRLESGFNVNTGAFSQGGREFGRPAYVGLANVKYGALLFGRQNEMIGDYVGAVSANGNWGILIPHPGDMDNNGIDYRLNNSIRYNSPTIAGFSGSALYSLGGVAGNFNRDSAASFGMNYVNGPLLVTAAYTTLNRPAESTTDGLWSAAVNPIDGNYGAAAERYQSLGAGAQYKLGNATFAIDWTNTKFLNMDPTLGAKLSGHVNFNIYEAVFGYYVLPTLQLGTSYSYTIGTVSANGQSPHYHTGGVIADYFFSKRTDAYLQGVYMRAAGDAPVAALTPTVGASSGRNQIAIRLGLRLKF
jgi:predicted porin